MACSCMSPEILVSCSYTSDNIYGNYSVVCLVFCFFILLVKSNHILYVYQQLMPQMDNNLAVLISLQNLFYLLPMCHRLRTGSRN